MALALPPELTAATRIATSMGVFGGFAAWFGWLIWRAVSKKQSRAESWALQGAGIGGVAGIFLGTISALA